jgi:hypothetical protein
MSEDATGTSGKTLAFKEVTGIKQVSEKLSFGRSRRCYKKLTVF